MTLWTDGPTGMAGVADWRKETDPRKCEALAELHYWLTEAAASGDAGKITFAPLDYWPNGFGMLEAGRSRKRDLSKLAKVG